MKAILYKDFVNFFKSRSILYSVLGYLVGGTYLSYSAVGNFGIPRTTRAYEIIFSIAAPTVTSLIPILYAMTRTGKLREDGDSISISLVEMYYCTT